MKQNFYAFPNNKKSILPVFSGLILALLVIHGQVSAQIATMFVPATEPVPASFGFAANLNDNGGATGIEVGVRFQATEDGVIRGIRYYQGGSDDGDHVVNLWSDDGLTLLATGSASAEATPAAPGWRQITFANTAITAGVTYVASVFSSTGYYNTTDFDFAIVTGYQSRTPVFPNVNGNNGEPNGTYIYTATSAFPSLDPLSATNYWVDVMFTSLTSLPVTYSSFTAATGGSSVSLSWTTAQEQNNKGFDVQRSTNGLSWANLAFVKGAGESSVSTDYGYVDKSLAPGKYFYRLKQTDLDGKADFSKVVSAEVTGKAELALYSNFPNPAQGVTTIRFDIVQTGRARLSLVDLNGREVKLLADEMAETGTHTITVNTGDLTKKLYFIKLQTGGKTLIRKMLVQ